MESNANGSTRSLQHREKTRKNVVSLEETRPCQNTAMKMSLLLRRVYFIC